MGMATPATGHPASACPPARPLRRSFPPPLLLLLFPLLLGPGLCIRGGASPGEWSLSPLWRPPLRPLAPSPVAAASGGSPVVPPPVALSNPRRGPYRRGDPRPLHGRPLAVPVPGPLPPALAAGAILATVVGAAAAIRWLRPAPLHPLGLPPWRSVAGPRAPLRPQDPTVPPSTGPSRLAIYTTAAAIPTPAPAPPGPRWPRLLLHAALSLVTMALCWHLRAVWIAQQAGQKFLSAWMLYLTIPLVAGLLGWGTNKLAVWMIFNPATFQGFPGATQLPGQPYGLVGWQGIVPAKVRKMGADIVRLAVEELVDLRALFAKLDPPTMARLMRSDLPDLLAIAATQASLLRKDWAQRFIGAEIPSDGARLPTPDTAAQRALVSWRGPLEELGERVVAGVVRGVTKEPLRYMAIKHTVVEAMARERRLICELFQRCGREELQFIVDIGLWGGAFLGLFQMGLWLLWDPPWSLALGGAAVGYVTNWLGIKAMFEPVIPWRGPAWLRNRWPLRGWRGFQGLFLTRQAEVSAEFAEFMSQEVLTVPRLWESLLAPDDPEARRPETRQFEQLLARVLVEEAGALLTVAALVDTVDPFQLPSERALRLARTVRIHLPAVVPRTYGYMERQLSLRRELDEGMRRMSPQQFEGVLHPIFQEDEYTLIVIGALLGGLAGALQVPFY